MNQRAIVPGAGVRPGRGEVAGPAADAMPAAAVLAGEVR